MRKALFISLILLALTSCGKSEDEQMNAMITEATKAFLYIPESYDPVSTQCDSMLLDIINDANIKKSAKIISLIKDVNNLQKQIERDVEQREYWRGKYNEFYRDYSKKVQLNEEKKNQSLIQAYKLFNELLEDYNKPKEFIGFIVEHRFRAKNNMGNVMFGDVIYILNKDKSSIVATYKTDRDDFLGFVQMIAAIQEIGEDYNINEIDLIDICDNIKNKFEFLYN